MTQKVLKVGSSAAVIIPKKSLKELGLKIGDDVRVSVDSRRRRVSISPQSVLSSRETYIAKLGVDFIKRYHKDLEILARS